MIKSKLSITQISLIFTSLLSVSLIIVSSVYSHQLSVLKRGYQNQSAVLQECQKNIFYQEECQTNQQNCPKQDCDDCPCPDCQTPTCDDMSQCITEESCQEFITLSNCQAQFKEQCQQCQDCKCEDKDCQCPVCSNSTISSNIFLLEGTYEGNTYQKVVKFQIESSGNAGYTIKEVCTDQGQVCNITPDNIITLNADGELELTTGNTATKLSSDATGSPTWTESSWGMPWSKNAIKVNLPVYASESDVLLQKDIQKIKSSSSVAQIEVEEEIGTVISSSIGIVKSDSTSNINVDTITQITSNVISNITINNGSVTKKETVLDGIRQLSSTETNNGITYISSPKISNISSTTIETIDTDYALSIKLTSVGTDTTKTAIKIENGVNGQIKIGGSISCDSETEACVNLNSINNANSSYALKVSGNVKSPVIFSKDSVVSATFTNEGTINNIVNKGTITNGITNDKGTIGDITNQADSTLGSVSNSGTMTSFTNNVGAILTGSIINKGTANNMKNEGGNITNQLQIIGGTLTNGLQINGGTIGSTSTTYGLSINGDTTIQGSQVGILIGSDGSKDDIKIQTSGGTYGILMQQATIGHTGLHRGINIDKRESYSANYPWVNIYSSSNDDSYAIFVGSNNVILHSSTGESTTDTHTYYHMEPQIQSKGFWGAVTQGNHYTCTAQQKDN